MGCLPDEGKKPPKLPTLALLRVFHCDAAGGEGGINFNKYTTGKFWNFIKVLSHSVNLHHDLSFIFSVNL